MLDKLRNNNYIVASVGNGLFTTGGHFVVLTKIDGDIIEVYDPYLYAGKFDTSTRRNKVTVSGNKVYVSIDNFKNYANAKQFFCYNHDGQVQENNQNVVTSTYTRYVNARSGLNVRNAPNGTRIGVLANNTVVTVYETSGNWSRIGTNEWVSSNYLSNYSNSNVSTSKITGYKTGNYKVTKVSNKSVLNVRYGAGTRYKIKGYKQLSSNARLQNKQNGNYYANGYKNGVVCTVTKVIGNWRIH